MPSTPAAKPLRDTNNMQRYKVFSRRAKNFSVSLELQQHRLFTLCRIKKRDDPVHRFCRKCTTLPFTTLVQKSFSLQSSPILNPDVDLKTIFQVKSKRTNLKPLAPCISPARLIFALLTRWPHSLFNIKQGISGIQQSGAIL